MLIPRFSVRWLLAAITVCAMFFGILSVAVRSSAPQNSFELRILDVSLAAAAVSMAIGSLAVMIVVHVLFFAMAWLASEVRGVFSSRKTAQSPFAQHRPAPQLLPPENPPET